MNELKILRGDIWYAYFKEDGHRQGGIRPCIVSSNDLCNKFSPVITVIPVTSRLQKNNIPTHVLLSAACGLDKQSIALVEGITSLNKTDLKYKIGRCTDDDLQKIEKAINIQNGIEPVDYNRIFMLINRINENIQYIFRYGEDSDSNIELATLKIELKSCCEKWNININNISKMILSGDKLMWGERVRIG